MIRTAIGSDIALISSLLSLGFFGGFSHCSGMCGPLVLTQVNSKLQNTAIDDFVGLARLTKLALLPYHFGRITTYSFIGLCCFFARQSLDNFFGFRLISSILLISGAVFFAAIFIAQNHKIAKKIIAQFSRFTNSTFLPIFISLNSLMSRSFAKNLLPFKSQFFVKFVSKLANFFHQKVRILLQKNDATSTFVLGLILGFIPCGMLYLAFTIASNFSSAIFALIGMLTFGVATFPALFSVAIFGKLLFKLPEFKIIANIALLANIFMLTKLALENIG